MSTRYLAFPAAVLIAFLAACSAPATDHEMASAGEAEEMAEVPEYFLLRPDVERAYGYTHAIKIGDDIKISGAVSMDDQGNPRAPGDLEQQMKNAYSERSKAWPCPSS